MSLSEVLTDTAVIMILLLMAIVLICFSLVMVDRLVEEVQKTLRTLKTINDDLCELINSQSLGHDDASSTGKHNV